MTNTKSATPYRWAILVGLAVFGIYLVTLAPTTAFWDTSEYIAAAKVLGIPHPPGNPLFVILAHTWGLLPLAGEYAKRINLFAAFSSAASAALWFLIAERWLRTIVPVRWGRLLAAAAGTLVSATSWTVWNQSTVNEKVYTVSLLSMALVTWLAVHWGDDEPGPHRDRWVVLIAYIIALSTTNHLMGLLAAPAVAIYILWTDWRVVTRPWVWVGIITAVVVGVSLNYLFLPIRAGLFPPINEGEPVGFFSKALMDVINRVQYAKPPVLDRQADLLSQFGNYLQYFRWQYARDWSPAASAAAAALFGSLGLRGLVALIRRDRRAGIAALAMFGTLTVALIFYLNFKYGFSMHPERDLPREVRERDYFFMGSFAYFGVLVALGLGAVYRRVADALADRLPDEMRWVMATPVFLLALIPLAGNHATATRSNEFLARDMAIDMLESVAPYGILITAGDNDTFPLWFAQEVLGVRPDVTLANLSLMNTRWHLRQLQRRATPEFDAVSSARVWRPSPTETGLALTDTAAGAPPPSWPVPEGSVFSSFSGPQLDSLPEAIAVKKGTGLRVDSLVMAFGQDYLTLQDIATVAMIRDNLGKRPIYFSWSDGNYPDATLGLTGYLLTTGLVRQLMPRPIVEGNGIVLSRTLGFVDLPLTRTLLWETYHWQSAAQDRPRGWVDVPSASILQLYGIIYRETGAILKSEGLLEEGARADSVAVAVQHNIIRGELN